jgi:hypothetical protein
MARRQHLSRRVIDWNTPDGVDPDTPVTDLHDTNDTGRDHFFLVSDEEQQLLAWIIFRAQRERELIDMRVERRRWHEQWWVRVTAVLTAGAAFGSMISQWIHR